MNRWVADRGPLFHLLKAEHLHSHRPQTFDEEPRRESTSGYLIAKVCLCLGCADGFELLDQVTVSEMAAGDLGLEDSLSLQVPIFHIPSPPTLYLHHIRYF